MFVVLTQGILEAALFAIDGLCPFGAIGFAKDPARVSLGFNYEDTKLANDNVVNLCGCPIGEGEVEVVENKVFRREAVTEAARNASFATNVLLFWTKEPRKEEFE